MEAGVDGKTIFTLEPCDRALLFGNTDGGLIHVGIPAKRSKPRMFCLLQAAERSIAVIC